MKHGCRSIHRLLVLALFSMLAACSGGSSGSDSNSSGSNPPGGSSPPEIIQGVATPSSVSVVTATNAS